MQWIIIGDDYDFSVIWFYHIVTIIFDFSIVRGENKSVSEINTVTEERRSGILGELRRDLYGILDGFPSQHIGGYLDRCC